MSSNSRRGCSAPKRSTKPSPCICATACASRCCAMSISPCTQASAWPSPGRRAPASPPCCAACTATTAPTAGISGCAMTARWSTSPAPRRAPSVQVRARTLGYVASSCAWCRACRRSTSWPRRPAASASERGPRARRGAAAATEHSAPHARAAAGHLLRRRAAAGEPGARLHRRPSGACCWTNRPPAWTRRTATVVIGMILEAKRREGRRRRHLPRRRDARRRRRSHVPGNAIAGCRMTVLTNARIVLPDAVVLGSLVAARQADRGGRRRAAAACPARSTATAISSSPAWSTCTPTTWSARCSRATRRAGRRARRWWRMTRNAPRPASPRCWMRCAWAISASTTGRHPDLSRRRGRSRRAGRHRAAEERAFPPPALRTSGRRHDGSCSSRRSTIRGCAWSA